MDLPTKFVEFVDESFWICRQNLFGFVDKIFWICRQKFLDLLKKVFWICANFKIGNLPMTLSNDRIVAWVTRPERPKGANDEVKQARRTKSLSQKIKYIFEKLFMAISSILPLL